MGQTELLAGFHCNYIKPSGLLQSFEVRGFIVVVGG